MAADRYVVLGLARARSPWFGDVARWATASSLPVDFVKCVSPEEVRARLAGGRAFSALLADAAAPGLDRDLLDAVRTAGCAVILVDDGRAAATRAELGASAVLDPGFDRHELLDVLNRHAAPVARVDAASFADVPAQPAGTGGWQGSLVAVTGAPGAGTSTVAIALAQGLAVDPARTGLVLLADLALDADQAVLHDAGDVVPGLPELVEAHRLGTPSAETVRSLAFEVPGRGYHVLLGLRRRRDWAALRPRATDAALDGLRRAWRLVVADVDADLDGEDQCGSTDVEDRNHLARSATASADLVVAVGHPGPKGTHALLRVLDGLLEHGVDPARIVTVVNRAPRGQRARAEHTRALAALARPLPGGTGLPAPVFVPERRHLDALFTGAEALPAALWRPVTEAVGGLLSRSAPVARPSIAAQPVAIAPGSLGTWSNAEE